MRKKLLIIFSITLGVFALFQIAEAAFTGNQFSGVVFRNKAKKIEALENANFACSVPGTSIEIRPKGRTGIQPTSFLIPSGVISKTKHPVRANQLIMGKYSGKVSVVCVDQSIPPVEETVTLDKITVFANSAR